MKEYREEHFDEASMSELSSFSLPVSENFDEMGSDGDGRKSSNCECNPKCGKNCRKKMINSVRDG